MTHAVTSTAHEVVRQHALRHGDARAVIGTDETGTVVYWNAAATQLYGWIESEALGRNIVDLTPTIMSRREAEYIMHWLLSGKPWRGDFTVHHRDGTVMVVYVEDEPVMHEGRVVGIVGVSSPATRR